MANFIESYEDELEKIAGSTDDLQPGDVLLMTMGAGEPDQVDGRGRSMFRSLATKVYSKLSPAFQGNFTHSGIYVGGGQVVEAHAEKGVQKNSLRTATKNKGYLVLRPKVGKSKRRKAALFAEKQVGKKYDMEGMMVAGVSLALPDKIAEGILRVAGRKARPGIKVNAYQCGGLVGASYEAAGAPATPVHWRFTSPKRIFDSASMNRIFLKDKGRVKVRESRLKEAAGFIREEVGNARV